MPVFFWVGGYFLFYSLKTCETQGVGYKRLLLNKVNRLLLPYLFWSVVSCIANITVTFIQNKSNVFGSYIDEIIDIFVYARSVWFLIIFFLAQAAGIAVCGIAQRCSVNKYMLLIVLWVVAFIQPIHELFAFYKFKWLFPFLILGMLCAEYELYNKANPKIWFIGCLFLSGRFFYREDYFNAYMRFEYSSLPEIFAGMGYYMLSILAICMAVAVGICLKETKCGKKIAELGQYSMDIYVMHMFLVKFILIVPDKVLNNDVFIYGYFVVYAGLIIVLAVFLSKYVLGRLKLFCMVTGRA